MDISRKYYLSAFSGSGDDGLDFVRRKVLRFVYNEVCVAQASSANVCQCFYYQLIILL